MFFAPFCGLVTKKRGGTRPRRFLYQTAPLDPSMLKTSPPVVLSRAVHSPIVYRFGRWFDLISCGVRSWCTYLSFPSFPPFVMVCRVVEQRNAAVSRAEATFF